MNKKNLLIAALPVFMAACSSEDVLTDVQSNDQYEGIAKVNAQFNIENGVDSRLANTWGLEDGDLIGLAWLGTGSEENADVKIDGKAYQNHPLYAESGVLKPKTSIYVGEYFSYAPYDYATRSVGKINFSVENQDLKELGENDEGYHAAAAKSIWISPKWTSVSLVGDLDKNGKPLDINKAGVDETFNMYPRKFSNMVQLVLTYKNNELEKAETPEIKGIEVSFPGSVVSFTYAPTEAVTTQEEKVADGFWYDYSLKDATLGAETSALAAKAATEGLISVPGVDAEEGKIKLAGKYLADGEGNTFLYNSLPSKGDVTKDTEVTLELTTTYGIVTITKKLSEIAKTYRDEIEDYDEYFDGEWDDEKQKLLSKVAADTSFVAALNKNGKFITEVDFLTAVMDGMHVENDAELQKMLNYYNNYKKGTEKYSEAKNDTDIELHLDGDASGVFELSTTSIALLREINNGLSERLVSVQPCTTTGEACTKLVITGGGEVPELSNVFETNVDVYLAGATNWTWTKTPMNGETNVNANAVGKNFGKVKTITNEGTLTVSVENVKARADKSFTTLYNAEGATINVKSVANVKFDVVNYGHIEVADDAELLAYGVTITNENWKKVNDVNPTLGTITNNGVIGVVKGTNGVINNYGYILNAEGAKTYITTNQTSNASFSNAWSTTNKIGTIMLTDKFDNISVSNATNQGFIKYTWNGESTYATPEPAVDVKYNYLIVKENIEFVEFENEVQYLEVAAGADIVITAIANDVFNEKKKLNGFILGKGAKANIKKGNKVNALAAYVAEGKLYVGGEFNYMNDLETYLGGSSANTDNIVEY